MPIVRNVLETAVRYAEDAQASKIISIHLVVGELHDLVDGLVQKYFGYASRGTMAEHAHIIINRTPAVCRCAECQENFAVHIHETDRVCCPVCGGKSFSIVMGNEFIIKEISIL